MCHKTVTDVNELPQRALRLKPRSELGIKGPRKSLTVRSVKEPSILLEEGVNIRMRLLRILSQQLNLPNHMSETGHVQHDREPVVRQHREPLRLKRRHRIQPEVVVEPATPVREMLAHELDYLAPVLGFGEGGA